jgi:Ser-tRNA(Ala) deacylase AlaX
MILRGVWWNLRANYSIAGSWEGFQSRSSNRTTWARISFSQAKVDSAAWKLGIKYKYTARDTPQQNHLAELAFATIINKAQAMASADIPVEVRYKLWKEAIQMATDLDQLILRTIEGSTKTRYEHAYKSNPKSATHLQTWGEAGTVKTKSTGTPKLHDPEAVCMRGTATGCGTR